METARPQSTSPSSSRRVVLGLLVLGLGLLAVTGLEAGYRTPRPLLKAELSSLPLELGRWIGRDEPMDPEILQKAQCDDYLNRIYEDPSRPGRPLRLWINYSTHGLNLRHTPEICLPSGGWEKIEAQTRILTVQSPTLSDQPIMRLAYQQDEVVQGIGFWYYIFGEGPLEQFARSLPISSRSSHGRTTRGSGLTVEVFGPGELDPEGESLKDFSAALLKALEPIMPDDRAHYYIP